MKSCKLYIFGISLLVLALGTCAVDMSTDVENVDNDGVELYREPKDVEEESTTEKYTYQINEIYIPSKDETKYKNPPPIQVVLHLLRNRHLTRKKINHDKLTSALNTALAHNDTPKNNTAKGKRIAFIFPWGYLTEKEVKSLPHRNENTKITETTLVTIPVHLTTINPTTENLTTENSTTDNPTTEKRKKTVHTSMFCWFGRLRRARKLAEEISTTAKNIK